jgi:hypothetical protein
MFGPKFDKINDLIWSPFKTDDFIAYGNDLNLYRLKNSKLKSSN